MYSAVCTLKVLNTQFENHSSSNSWNRSTSSYIGMMPFLHVFTSIILDGRVLISPAEMCEQWTHFKRWWIAFVVSRFLNLVSTLLQLVLNKEMTERHVFILNPLLIDGEEGFEWNCSTLPVDISGAISTRNRGYSLGSLAKPSQACPRTKRKHTSLGSYHLFWNW